MSNPTFVPTFKSIGLEVAVGPDLGLSYRQAGTPDWKTMSLLGTYPNLVRASLLALEPDTDYEVRLAWPGQTPEVFLVRTRSEDVPQPLRVFVVATNGDDTTGTGSEANPWRTVTRALQTMGPGDACQLRGGTYTEAIDILRKQGTEQARFYLEPWPGEEVVLDGQKLVLNNIRLNRASWWVIRNLTLKNPTGSNIRIVGSQGPTNDNWVVGCQVLASGSQEAGGGVDIHQGAARLVVRDCEITAESTIPFGQRGVSVWKGGGGHIIYRNRITGPFRDGLGGGENFTATGFPGTDADIYENYIDGVVDDGIEMEGLDTNVRCWDNVIFRTGKSCIGIAPVLVGPIYIFRNIGIDFSTSGVKLGSNVSNGSPGWVFGLHNTLWSDRANGLSTYGGSSFANQWWMNNIIRVGRYVFEFLRQAQVVNIVVDYNTMFTTRGSPFCKWNGTPYDSLSQWQRKTGQGPHSTPGEPLLSNPLAGDVTPVDGSPAIDAGVSLPGLNDDYMGAAPDAGKVEAGGTAPPPQVSIRADPPVGYAPLSVAFSLANTGGAISAYSWDFGDGTTSNEDMPSHIFQSPGTYTVSLEATGPGGSATAQAVVEARPIISPIAGFSFAPDTGVVPLTIQFTDVSQPGSGIDSWEWDFGDGNVSQEQSPANTYSVPGDYTVRLRVSGPGGVSEASGVVRALAPAPPAFSISDLAVSPAEAFPGTALTVEMVVANAGGDGSFVPYVALTRGGQVVREATGARLVLAGGQSLTLTFSLSAPGEGLYDLYAACQDGVLASRTVPDALRVLEPVSPGVPVGKILTWAAIFSTLVALLRRR